MEYEQAHVILSNPENHTNGEKMSAAMHMARVAIKTNPDLEGIITPDFILAFDEWSGDCAPTVNLFNAIQAAKMDAASKVNAKRDFLTMIDKTAPWIERERAARNIAMIIEKDCHTAISVDWLLSQDIDPEEFDLGFDHLAEAYDRDVREAYDLYEANEAPHVIYDRVERLETMLNETSRRLRAAEMMINDRIDNAAALWPSYLEDADHLEDREQ